jgi:hypothetical protein
MTRENYFVERNHNTDEVVYLEYDKIDGYKITPKTKMEDAISVEKVVIASPSMSSKIIKKKINNIITKILKFIENIDDSTDGESIRENLMKAEKLRISIITKYIKYLGNNYSSLTLKKLELMANKLESELYKKELKNRYLDYLLFNNYQENNKGKGR